RQEAARACALAPRATLARFLRGTSQATPVTTPTIGVGRRGAEMEVPMIRYIAVGSIACLAFALGCDQQRSEVEQQTQSLKEAQGNVAEVTKKLEGELQQAKDKVVQLEQKLALARQGITDEVLEERKDLEQALKEQKQRVQTEVNEAKQAAEKSNKESSQ